MILQHHRRYPVRVHLAQPFCRGYAGQVAQPYRAPFGPSQRPMTSLPVRSLEPAESCDRRMLPGAAPWGMLSPAPPLADDNHMERHGCASRCHVPDNLPPVDFPRNRVGVPRIYQSVAVQHAARIGER